MKKTVLLGFVGLATLSVTSNVAASSVTALLTKAFPQSMFTSKCTASNAKINWNLVAQAEQNGGTEAIQQKIAERVTPCLNASNPNYQTEFKENCAVPSAVSNAKNQVCGGGQGTAQSAAGSFVQNQQQHLQQGGFVAQPQQQPVMGVPVQGQENIQALEARLQTLEQESRQIMSFLKQLYPYMQQLDAKVTQMQR